MTMFNEEELIRQLEEQRAMIVQRDEEIHRLQGEVEMLNAALNNSALSTSDSGNQERKAAISAIDAVCLMVRDASKTAEVIYNAIVEGEIPGIRIE